MSPDSLADLRRFVEAVAANPEALLFIEGRPCAGESDASIVDGGWSFARINRAYRENLAVHETMPRVSASPTLWRQWLARERATWQAALEIDPLLPQRLLPAGYLGRESLSARRWRGTGDAVSAAIALAVQAGRRGCLVRSR